MDVAEGLDRINMSALDLLMDSRDNYDDGGSTAKTPTKAKSREKAGEKEKEKESRRRPPHKPSSTGSVSKLPTKNLDNVRSKVDSGNRRRVKKVTRKKEAEPDEERSSEVLGKEIRSISERLKNRLSCWD